MLTILTPTYNRRHTLPRLYESLLCQSGRDFEWLVVDDGSTDETAAWVETHCTQTDFPVRLVRQSNGGKHVALNTGVAHARGNWIFVVDSDDALTPDAVAVVAAAMASAGGEPDIVGVCFRKADMGGHVLGRPCDDAPVRLVGTPTAIGRMVQGELAYVFRRDIMAATPFPVIEGEKFVPDLYAWNLIGDQGDIWFYLGRAVYRCEYLEDGYTRNFTAHLRRNPRGFFMFYAAQIAREPQVVDKLKAVVRSIQCLAYRLYRV